MVDDPIISAEILLLGLGYEKYRDKKDGKSTTESDSDPGSRDPPDRVSLALQRARRQAREQ